MPLSNPLNSAVNDFMRKCLHQPMGEVRESALFEWLKSEQLLDASLTDSVALYQAHFLVRNALYRFADGHPAISWQFSAVGISWQPAVQSQDAAAQLASTDGSAALRAYYLDMGNLAKDRDGVEALLAQFWRRYARHSAHLHEDSQTALRLLELEAPVTFAEIKRQYRRKAMAAHPDRGGSDAQLQALNNALDLLRVHYKS